MRGFEAAGRPAGEMPLDLAQVGSLTVGGLLTGRSSRRRRVRWCDRRIRSLAVSRDGRGARIQAASFEYPTMLREALRRNGFQGSGDSAATRLTGLLTLCRQGCRVYSVVMAHTISIHNGGELAGNQEPEFSVKNPDIDVPPTLCQGSFSTIRPMNRIPRRNAMANRRRYQNRPRELRIHPVTAFAHEPCQITHAPATSCLMYTCAHRRWR